MQTLSIESLELLEILTDGPDVADVELVEEEGGLSVQITSQNTWRRVWLETQNDENSLTSTCEAEVIDAMRGEPSLVRLALECQAGPTTCLTPWEVEFYNTLAARVSTTVPAREPARQASLHDQYSPRQ